jgi:CheY-like chemotaxis protein
MGLRAMVCILIIEDDAAIRRLLQVNFAARGYTVLLATTGHEGLRLARDQRPAIILVDYRIPDMSGIEIIQHISADPATSGTPCLLVTGAAPELMTDFSSAQGITSIIYKPIDLPSLYRMVAELVQR